MIPKSFHVHRGWRADLPMTGWASAALMLFAAMSAWRRHGLLAVTINLQGGSPQGYSQDHPWHNSAIETDGSLRPDFLHRLEQILNRAGSW